MKKLFTNDKFFLATVLVAIFGVLFNDVVAWIAFPAARSCIIMDVLSVLCTLVLYTSYKKHSKNVMKCVIGALLMLILLRPLSTLTGGAFAESPAFAIVAVFDTLFAVALFISHNLINSDHHSNAGYVSFNQLLSVLIAVCEIVFCGFAISGSDSVLITISYICGALGFAGVVAALVCVESRLDAYRLDREAAGWTEEKGYPENYVHQYEKK